MKEMILSKVDYIDIDKYIKKEHIPEKIDNRTEKIEEAKRKIEAEYLKEFLFEPSPGSESLFVQLLSMINYFRGSEEKKILCINKDIKPAFDGSNPDHFVLLGYPNPINKNVIKRTGNMIPTFITATSKYINDTGDSEFLKQLGAKNISDDDLPSNFQYCIDEYHFSGLLDKLNSLLFNTDLSIHVDRKYKGNRKEAIRQLTAIEQPNEDDSGDDRFVQTARQLLEEIQKNQRKLLESINDGFLSVQNNTMAELKYLL